MKLDEDIKNYLKHPNRINILSTAKASGETNIAIFGTPELTEEYTLSMVLQDNSRSYKNLKENPYASCLVLIPVENNKMDGCRIYLKVNRILLTRNPVFLKEREEGDKTAWEENFNTDLESETKKRIQPERHLVVFDILNARPIVDTGKDE